MSGEALSVEVSQDLPYYRQILELLRLIVSKLSDIHEELSNQQTIIIEDRDYDEGSNDSYDSPV